MLLFQRLSLVGPWRHDWTLRVVSALLQFLLPVCKAPMHGEHPQTLLLPISTELPVFSLNAHHLPAYVWNTLTLLSLSLFCFCWSAPPDSPWGKKNKITLHHSEKKDPMIHDKRHQIWPEELLICGASCKRSHKMIFHYYLSSHQSQILCSALSVWMCVSLSCTGHQCQHDNGKNTLREANSTACLSKAAMPCKRVARICCSCVWE